MSHTNIGKKNGNSRYLQIPRDIILNLKFYVKLIKYKEETDISKHENVEINNPHMHLFDGRLLNYMLQ